MTGNDWLPVLVLLSSFVTGVAILLLPEERRATRSFLNLAGATVKVGLVAWMIAGIEAGERYQTRLALLPGLDLYLFTDGLTLLFATLSAVLWLLTTVYAIGYLADSHDQRRFFGFFSLCVTATMGVALAGNPITFLVFYELLTLSTWPLVIHEATPAALRGGRIYLTYTLAGGAVLFLATALLHATAGPVEFRPGGSLGPELLDAERARLLFALFVVGLGVKAALVPLHGWLPEAMVAPAPVSALLHAVAVVKAGAFGIVRVVYELFGVGYAAEIGVLHPLAIAASITIVYGSIRALGQENLKRRLAWSTVSQVSYITLGTALAGAITTTGGLVHLVHQGLMKITLFFCAGALAHGLGIHEIRELDGAGRKMPWTMAAFSVGAFGMIGTPPVAGFVSKWYLGVGAVAAGQRWAVVILVASTLLNAAYFLPLLHRAWFRQPAAGAREHAHGDPRLVVPPVTTALLSLAVGLAAGAAWSPLSWAEFVALGEFVR